VAVCVLGEAGHRSRGRGFHGSRVARWVLASTPRMSTDHCPHARTRRVLLTAAVLTGVMFWLRRHPSACPYALRLSLQPPHPLITRARLNEILAPLPGERMLEIGPGSGYYTLPLAQWLGADGCLDILDVQQPMLDYTMRRARRHGIENLAPVCGDARRLPFDDATFDAVILITTLGEIPDQDTAWREMARVLKPAGRVINGELFFGDPHWVTPRAAERHASTAGLTQRHRIGTAIGYFARYEHC